MKNLQDTRNETPAFSSWAATNAFPLYCFWYNHRI